MQLARTSLICLILILSSCGFHRLPDVRSAALAKFDEIMTGYRVRAELAKRILIYAKARGVVDPSFSEMERALTALDGLTFTSGSVSEKDFNRFQSFQIILEQNTMNIVRAGQSVSEASAGLLAMGNQFNAITLSMVELRQAYVELSTNHNRLLTEIPDKIYNALKFSFTPLISFESKR